MKKIVFTCILMIPVWVIAQTCTNCGIGTNTPSSKLQVRGCGIDSTVSTFNATDSNNVSIIYARDDKRVGINTTAPLATLHIVTSATSGPGTYINANTITTGNGLFFPLNGLTSGSGLDITSNSTAGTASGSSKMINIARSGANANSSHTAYGIYSGITNTGTTSTNIGGYFSASGATNNYGLIVPSGGGNVGIGTSTPVSALNIYGNIQTGSLGAVTGSSVINMGYTAGPQINLYTQYGSVGWTMGVESGYNMWTRFVSGNQGLVGWDFSGSVNLTMSNGTSSPFLNEVSNKNWVLGAGGGGNGSPGSYALYLESGEGSISSSGASNLIFDRYAGASGFSRAYDPVVAIRNGTWLDSDGNLIGEKAYWYRNGFIGIGTTTNDDETTQPLVGAISVNQGTKTGYIVGNQSTAVTLSTSGSSTVVSNNNGVNGISPYGLTVGSQVTANSMTRTVTEIRKTTFYIDSPVDWSAGYTFTYRNPYLSFRDGTTTMMIVDPNGLVGLGTSSPTSILHLKDGHLRSEQTTAPTIAVTTQNGITADAIATNSSDMKGTITTTGTNNGTNNTVLTITFNKTFTVAPTVIITAANSTAQACTYYVGSSTTTFTLNFINGGATPSFNYIVIE